MAGMEAANKLSMSKGASMFFSLQSQNHIFFIENPRLENCGRGRWEDERTKNMTVLTPVLPSDVSAFERKEIFLEMIRSALSDEKIDSYTFATNTCKVVPYLRHLSPDRIIYEQDDREAITNPELFCEMNEYAD